MSRLTREQRTIGAMIRLYCRDQHKGKAGLCSGCRELLAYSIERLDKCPFQEGKTTCSQCPVHCFRRDMREKIKTVMRYAGPRMLCRHSFMALRHIVDGLRKKSGAIGRKTRPS